MKEESKKAGSKGHNILSGKALFKYDPNLFQDDENAAEEDIYEEREEDFVEEESKESDQKKLDAYSKDSEKIKSSVPTTNTDSDNIVNGDTKVDADLFQQEDDEGEEPDFE